MQSIDFEKAYIISRTVDNYWNNFLSNVYVETRNTTFRRSICVQAFVVNRKTEFRPTFVTNLLQMRVKSPG
jgi:hypothetical protein